MVPGAEAADLVQAAVDGPAADLGRVDAADGAAVFAPVQVTLAAVAVCHGVGGPAQQQLFQLPRPGSCHTPPRPAPRGIAAASWSITLPSTAASSSAARSAASRRTPQEMSKPTPPGEITPPAAMSVAATPPIGNPYPQCTSGIAYDARTMPGSSATLATCSSERSAAGSGISARVANTTPGTRIRPCRGMTKRYRDSATISTSRTPFQRAVPPATRLCGWIAALICRLPRVRSRFARHAEHLVVGHAAQPRFTMMSRAVVIMTSPRRRRSAPALSLPPATSAGCTAISRT